MYLGDKPVVEVDITINFPIPAGYQYPAIKCYSFKSDRFIKDVAQEPDLKDINGNIIGYTAKLKGNNNFTGWVNLGYFMLVLKNIDKPTNISISGNITSVVLSDGVNICNSTQLCNASNELVFFDHLDSNAYDISSYASSTTACIFARDLVNLTYGTSVNALPTPLPYPIVVNESISMRGCMYFPTDIKYYPGDFVKVPIYINIGNRSPIMTMQLTIYTDFQLYGKGLITSEMVFSTQPIVTSLPGGGIRTLQFLRTDGYYKTNGWVLYGHFTILVKSSAENGATIRGKIQDDDGNVTDLLCFNTLSSNAPPFNSKLYEDVGQLYWGQIPIYKNNIGFPIGDNDNVRLYGTIFVEPVPVITERMDPSVGSNLITCSDGGRNRYMIYPSTKCTKVPFLYDFKSMSNDFGEKLQFSNMQAMGITHASRVIYDKNFAGTKLIQYCLMYYPNYPNDPYTYVKIPSPDPYYLYNIPENGLVPGFDENRVLDMSFDGNTGEVVIIHTIMSEDAMSYTNIAIYYTNNIHANTVWTKLECSAFPEGDRYFANNIICSNNQIIAYSGNNLIAYNSDCTSNNWSQILLPKDNFGWIRYLSFDGYNMNILICGYSNENDGKDCIYVSTISQLNTCKNVQDTTGHVALNPVWILMDIPNIPQFPWSSADGGPPIIKLWNNKFINIINTKRDNSKAYTMYFSIDVYSDCRDKNTLKRTEVYDVPNIKYLSVWQQSTRSTVRPTTMINNASGYLFSGEIMYDATGTYFLYMNPNGKLNIKSLHFNVGYLNGNPKYATGESEDDLAVPGSYAMLTSDGHLQLMDPNNNLICSSNNRFENTDGISKSGTSPFYMIFDNGFLIIKDAQNNYVWQYSNGMSGRKTIGDDTFKYSQPAPLSKVTNQPSEVNQYPVIMYPNSKPALTKIQPVPVNPIEYKPTVINNNLNPLKKEISTYVNKELKNDPLTSKSVNKMFNFLYIGTNPGANKPNNVGDVLSAIKKSDPNHRYFSKKDLTNIGNVPKNIKTRLNNFIHRLNKNK